IHSSALLLRSGLGGPLVGRHYMLHLCPVVLGVFRQPLGADETFVKQVGFSDYYLGSGRHRDKLGLIQSLPVPGPLMLSKASGGRIPEALIAWLRKRLLPLTGIVEDLPRFRNRVFLNRRGQVEVRHAFDPFDLERGRRLSRLMGRILKNAG